MANVYGSREISEQLQSGNKYDGKTFSGCDMQAIIANKVVGTLQAVTVSISRETLPIYVMGNPTLASITRGKIGIAGTLVFSNFDRNSLLMDVFADKEGTSWFYRRTMSQVIDIAKQTNGYDNGVFSEFGGTNSIQPVDKNAIMNGTIGTATASLNIQKEVAAVYDLVMNHRKLMYSNQLPPFDLVITMVNDSGQGAWCSINGISLINEGFGFTMDDLTSETAYTYIARSVTPLVGLDQQINFMG
jgi:hypothetical protein